MIFRTDLALERVNSKKLQGKIKGVQQKVTSYDNMVITDIKIRTPKASAQLQKDIGEYITIEVPSFSDWIITDNTYIDIIGKHIEKLIKPKNGTTLVVGLGNLDITSDSLGIKTINRVLATRHISEEVIRVSGIGSLSKVATFCTSVMGKTGIETAEIIKGLVKTILPSTVILVDALACSDIGRLGSTIQISNTGISPGSGVNNKRREINKDFLGVDVISIGVPTVVDAVTLAEEVVGADIRGTMTTEQFNKMGFMMVTPKEIDLLVNRSSNVLGLAINKALQPHISVEDINFLID